MDNNSDWPTEPPQPIDLSRGKTARDVGVQECQYCLELYYTDGMCPTENCRENNPVIERRVPNDCFAIVVPEKTGYLWIGKTNGFAISYPGIQGTVIPLGQVKKYTGEHLRTEVGVEMFEEFDDPEQAYSWFLKGAHESPDNEYGHVNLGQKLVHERLKGVYLDDEERKEELFDTLPERLQAVWDEIDEHLPFTYERVAAPKGKPMTQEGLRWINITGYNHDNSMIQPHWVKKLAEREGPVALYYPNCD